ncbi:hypothetical protein [Actinophytocola xinjiangensis]|nr:hypothetical protein [Actinophytocola xinjiangensis]
MNRLLTNSRFWMLAFVVTWLILVTVLIALSPTIAPTDAAPPR